mmetsp:Transcript_29869/g.54717  ORF Transcript_29869/g.54717 Transcript_29869/m.54717 type:complete len:177 (+) Transcript_29869:71-601(+)
MVEVAPAAAQEPLQAPAQEEKSQPVAKDGVRRAFLTHEPLSLDELYREVNATSCGAVVTFSGTTRDNFEGKEVKKLEYEAYEPMALKELQSLVDEALSGVCGAGVRHVACGHRLGVVPQGEASVIIAVGSEHRREGFSACSFLIDSIKAKVPIWKREIYTDGSAWKANKEWEPPVL